MSSFSLSRGGPVLENDEARPPQLDELAVREPRPREELGEPGDRGHPRWRAGGEAVEPRQQRRIQIRREDLRVPLGRDPEVLARDVDVHRIAPLMARKIGRLVGRIGIEDELGDVLAKAAHRREAAGPQLVQIGPVHVERLRVRQHRSGEVVTQLDVRGGEPRAGRRVLRQRGEEPRGIVAERNGGVVRPGIRARQQVSSERGPRRLVHGAHRAARDELLEAFIDEVHHRWPRLQVGPRRQQIAERATPLRGRVAERGCQAVPSR